MPKIPQTSYVVTDDYDGKPLPEDTKPTRLVHEGKAYDLYLSEKNRDALIEFLDSYVANAEPVAPAAPRRASKAVKVDRPGLHEWANDNGFKTAGKGRVSKDVLDAYDAAHA